MAAAPSPEDRGCPLSMNRRLLTAFLDHVQSEAADGLDDGTLDLPGLRRMAEAFLAETTLSVRAPADCLRLHDSMLWEDRRQRTFERLLTRRFSHLFPKRRGDDGTTPPTAPLSRRLIPGLMTALTMMVGVETIERCSREAADLLTRHRGERLGLVQWPDLAANETARALVAEVLAAGARHFEPFSRRRDWLCLVINNHLSSSVPEDHDPAWRCTTEGAEILLRALYEPLQAELTTDGAAAIRDRVGAEGVAAVRKLVAALTAPAAASA